jgi:hypothetical protein
MPDTDTSDADTERVYPICAEASRVYDFAILSFVKLRIGVLQHGR